LPFAVDAYTHFQEKAGVPIIKKASVALIHPSLQMKESFDYRLAHENVYLLKNDTPNWKSFFETPFGTGEIDSCYWIDLVQFLETGREKIKDHYIEASLEIEDLKLNSNGVTWKNISAEKIIFCDGVQSMKNPFFKALPFAPNKGEALIVAIEGLPAKNIYKNNISIVPWKDNLFWVGASFEWKYENENPTITFKEKMISALDSILTIPYKIVDHLVGIRPANTERRPFVGLHPIYPQLGICNGMGTKGCSLAPYFTHQLIEHIENNALLHVEVDVQRFKHLINS
jgi:glycine/D-amino acid oxidase-like deaminating enzyme